MKYIRGYLGGLTVLLVTLFSVPLPAFASPGSNSFDSPNFAFTSTGTTYITDSCSYETLTLPGAGGLFLFSGFYWDTGAVTFGRFGFSCDSAGDVMNITGMTSLTVTLYLTGSSEARVWAPDFGDFSVSVTGASYVYDAVNHIVELTATDPGVVVITWYVLYTNPSRPSTSYSNGAQLITNLIPFITVLMILYNPQNYKLIIKLALIIFVVMVLASVLYSWGS